MGLQGDSIVPKTHSQTYAVNTLQTWGCVQVVVPDADDSKKDIVSFLDNDLAGDSKDDAEQRGASAMLALIAGVV